MKLENNKIEEASIGYEAGIRNVEIPPTTPIFIDLFQVLFGIYLQSDNILMLGLLTAKRLL